MDPRTGSDGIVNPALSDEQTALYLILESGDQTPVGVFFDQHPRNEDILSNWVAEPTLEGGPDGSRG